MRRLAPLLLALAAGCAPRMAVVGEPPAGPVLVRLGEARVEVRAAPEEGLVARQVALAVALALPRATRWGQLEAPVVITVHPTHAALEEAARRPGYPWLRAWARYGSIELQSPASWGTPGGGGGQLVELLTHELTHCVLYQRSADQWTWPAKEIPLWFREGMASVTAGQEARRASPEELWRFYRQAPVGGGDPLEDPEPLYRERSREVYGAAHHAFRFLVDRYGEGRVREALARMRQGARFPQAFRESFGIGAPEFAADFRRYLVWQGWRRAAQLLGVGGPLPTESVQSSSGSLGRRTTEAVSQSRSP